MKLESFGEFKLDCPHCGVRIRDWSPMWQMGDLGGISVSCDECHKKIRIIKRAQYTVCKDMSGQVDPTSDPS